MSLTTTTPWIQGIGFEVETREHHQFTDGKKEFGGRDRGPNPKEYVLAELCGCSGMDVVSLMTKYCGVSAMLSKAVDINYSLIVNSQKIAAGKAAFEVVQY